MSGLRKKLNSLGTEMGLMEMMLAGVKSALMRQQFRVPQDLRNLAVAQEATGWTHLFGSPSSGSTDSKITLATKPQRRTMP